jgi:hypothetical protein
MVFDTQKYLNVFEDFQIKALERTLVKTTSATKEQNFF